MLGDEDRSYPIRTVCVKRPMVEDDAVFKKRMNKCGHIDPQIYTYKEDVNHRVSFVTFKSTRGARNALKSTKSKTVDEWLERKFIDNHLRGQWPFIEPDFEADYITHLNNNCIFNICSFLGLDDLQSLSQVSQRFSAVAKSAISKTVVRFYVQEKLRDDGTDDEYKRVKNFLESFGNYVSNLELTVHTRQFRDSNRRFLELIPKYCSKNCLRRVALADIDTNDFPIESFLKSGIFSNLNALKMKITIEGSLDEILKLCPSLNEIKISPNDDSKQMNGSFLKYLPSDIRRVAINGFIEEQILHQFIERSSQLKELSCPVRNTYTIAKIVKHQPRLLKFKMLFLGRDVEDFHIDNDALSIKNFKQLKSLTLDPWYEVEKSLIYAVANIGTVEELIIDTEEENIEVIIPAINKMKKLKRLRIGNYPKDNGDAGDEWKKFLSSLPVTLPNLEYLDIDGFGLIYDNFLPLIGDHRNLRKLVIYEWHLKNDEFDMESFRNTVRARARGQPKFPIILKASTNNELDHFLKISNKYDHLVAFD